MAGEFPVSFNFKAFDNVSDTINGVSTKLEGFSNKVTQMNNKFAVSHKASEHFREKLESVGEKIAGVGEKMDIFVTLPLELLKHKFNEASLEAEETANRFGQVFSHVDEAAKASAIGSLRDKFQLSNQSAQEMLATTGLFAKNLGFGEKASLGMGEKLAELSVQMAAFRGHGQSAEEMSGTLQAALLGNVRGLKTLGITIDDTEIRQEALRAAQAGARFETVEQAKAMATLAVIQRKTTDDQKDFAENQDKMANQIRVSKELFKEISVTIGNLLRPSAERTLRVMMALEHGFLNMSPAGQKVIVTLGMIVMAIGPVLTVIGKLTGSVIPAMMTGWEALTAVTWAGIAPWLLWIGAIAAVIAAGYLLYENWDTVKKFFAAFWDGPLGNFIKIATPIGWLISAAGLIYKNWEPIKEFFGNLWGWISDKFETLVMPKIQWLMDIGKKAGSWLLFGDKGSPFADQAGGGAGGAQPSVSDQAGGIKDQAQAIGQGIVKEMRSTNDAKVQIDFSNMPRGTAVSSQATGISPFLNLGAMGAPL